MIVYSARSGEMAKVGITNRLGRRRGEYTTHNPAVQITPKIYSLTETEAKATEKIIHEILGASTGEEWIKCDDSEIDAAVEAAKEAREIIRWAGAMRAITVIGTTTVDREVARRYIDKDVWDQVSEWLNELDEVITQRSLESTIGYHV